MRMFLLGLLALLAAGCGAGEPRTAGVSSGASDEAPSPPTLPTPDPAQLYEADVTVLEQGRGTGSRRHGPELCLGVVLTSLPPLCGGVPIANWDWTTFEGEESRGGTTWGDFHVVGMFDGRVFTVTEISRYDQEGADLGGDRDFTTSCPEPESGWVALDPARTSEDDFAAGAAVAEALPNYVALWIDYAEELPPEGLDERASSGEPVLWIMNVVVTADAAGAEVAIREAWGGPLCVTARPGHTGRELMAIRRQAERYIGEALGLELTWSREGDLGLAAEVGVGVDPGGAGQAALDVRYGPGMVLLFPALRPVER
jgi:hypothetical protein